MKASIITQATEKYCLALKESRAIVWSFRSIIFFYRSLIKHWAENSSSMTVIWMRWYKAHFVVYLESFNKASVICSLSRSYDSVMNDDFCWLRRVVSHFESQHCVAHRNFNIKTWHRERDLSQKVDKRKTNLLYVKWSWSQCHFKSF